MPLAFWQMLRPNIAKLDNPHPIFLFWRDFMPDTTTERKNIPPGKRVYAIGDIHGRHDLLVRLLSRIVADIDPALDTTVIYLGDMIDRGPDSARVMETIQTPLGDKIETVWLLGNHEQGMLDFLSGDFRHGLEWMMYGGAETLESFGVALPNQHQNTDSELTRMHDDLHAALAPIHKRFLDQLQHYRIIGDYAFVHAGIRPGIALKDQDHNDLIWIRRAFLDSKDDHGKVIVHGHSVTTDIDFHPNRIGVDTGAVLTGCLSALVLEGSSRRFLQTSRPMDIMPAPAPRPDSEQDRIQGPAWKSRRRLI